MSRRELSVLLVEDSEMVAELVTIWLTECEEPALAVERVTRLDEALARLSQGGIDVMLLDLSLPDSKGLDTVSRAVAHSPDVPAVVLTASSDPDQALGAVKAGAQDYLFKMHMNGESLQRALVYAIERHKKRMPDAQARERDWIEAEIERITESAHVAWGAGDADAGALEQNAPEAFEELSALYNAVLTRIVDASHEGTPYDASDELRSIATALAEEWAGPDDVVALHARALRTGLSQAAVEDLKLNPDLTRGLGLKLMGHLVAAYRALAITARGRRRARTMQH